MKLSRSLRQAIALVTLLSASNLAVYAADIPLSKSLEADEVTTKVLAVDAAKHQVVLEGPEGRQVHVQLTEKAKNLGQRCGGPRWDLYLAGKQLSVRWCFGMRRSGPRTDSHWHCDFLLPTQAFAHAHRLNL